MSISNFQATKEECPICGSTNLATPTVEGKDTGTRNCNDCNALFHVPNPGLTSSDTEEVEEDVEEKDPTTGEEKFIKKTVTRKKSKK